MITSPHSITDVEEEEEEVSKRETTSATIEMAINNQEAAVDSTGLSLTISKMMILEIAADIVL